jgi:hypothetical protein
MPPAAMTIADSGDFEHFVKSENKAMDEAEEETAGAAEPTEMGRKRGSPLSNPKRNKKKQRRNQHHNNTMEPEDDEEVVEEGNNPDSEKENNGRRPSRSSSSSRRSETTQDINSALARHRNVNPAGKPPEAGVILKIYVENFMCHKKLTVDLCRNVNFIYGQNGSGKVRVLCCIATLLGCLFFKIVFQA